MSDFLSHNLSQVIKAVSVLTTDERKKLLELLLQEKELSTFSFLTSHSVLEKEWLTAEEDKAWENL